MPEHTLMKSANDFSNFLRSDMMDKLNPINKSIEDMLARLEEFQTVICFAKQERMNAISLLSSIHDSSSELTALCERISSVEKLIEHVKSNLVSLELAIEKAEEELGCTESTTSRMANIFTPLFKKQTEKKHSTESLQIYKTEDYFF